ncbi:pantoate--beta-alanine ligase [Bacillus sp. FJAT-42315]|uniref:pantoate--beta-alanine ligase n=1 Tax=Bacillus sp. FJAT-42315 TaxID=2014077 RepID=UPI000C23AC55|nr:pantoate--beta-alanine ligase [Bacillus sp. FJAT-42315]
MIIIKQVKELTAIVSEKKKAGLSIGLVPTMGYLHEGHLTLARKAKAENDVVVMSIFVNPLQFGPNEDFESYPRDLEHDHKLAEEAGVDILFAPEPDEMYPKPSMIIMSVVERTDRLCGEKRPGHFDGVVTVVTKLFHVAQPDRAYFGLKDAQQVAVINGLVESLNFPLEVIGVETVREEDGLAKSSRNVYLTATERQLAPHMYRALKAGKDLAEQGEKDPTKVVNETIAYLNEHAKAEIDYVELLSFPDLTPIQTVEGQVILAAAVKYSNARLIDNIIFECE